LVQDLFLQASQAAPCVIVLDDADDLLPERSDISGSVASAERGIVDAFLRELDGFGGRIEGALIILTTNRFDHLDRAARSRFSLKRPIPYPLDRVQVAEIVDETAHALGLDISEVRESLIERFMAPVVRPGEPLKTRQQRGQATENLFAPRDIQAAMRLLSDGVSVRYRPHLDDVRRMERQLDRMSGLFED
jgi:SpoVK/Ycf46/Vps4 family AAA+-type ATPase